MRSCFFVYQLKSFSEIKSVKTLRHAKAELSLLIVIEIFLSVMQHCWPYCSTRFPCSFSLCLALNQIQIIFRILRVAALWGAPPALL